MEQTPTGYNSPEEYFQALDQKSRSRRGIFVNSTTAHHQTRQGRGTIAGNVGAFINSAVGDSSSYDEAYGPSNRVRRGGGYTGSSASTYDEGLQARLNSRDDARAAEAKAKADPPKKPRKKKSK
jgi:hypothetical protein